MTTKITKQEAKHLGMIRFFTGEPCKHGHISERRVSSGECIECNLISARKHKATEQWAVRRAARINSKKETGEWQLYCRDKHLRLKYGLSQAAVEAMARQQSNRCAVCEEAITPEYTGSTDTTAHVDHNHRTGKVRGLLCHHCNKAIGHFKESTKIMQNAISYLRQFEEKAA
jgi:nitrate/TMAO reductase-like tetraheme cytochrome c subunit